MAILSVQGTRQRQVVQELLSEAGITIGGPQPWDMRVSDERVFSRILARGSLGLGDAYLDEWWDCPRLDMFFARLMRAELDLKIKTLSEYACILKAKLLNLQNPKRAYVIGERHYDSGNELFSAMLDKRMIYSCAYWKNASTLDEAQEAKLDLVCRKLGLKPGMRLLDIGCGWGGMAVYAAEHYGAEVVGVTVSKEQLNLTRKRHATLPVEFRLMDYRDLSERFDRIVSIGMFEHVGHKNYATFFRIARRCLNDNGLMLLHTIGTNRTTTGTDPWICQHVFPNSALPSAKLVCAASEQDFVMEDWHNFGADYDPTLMHWCKNFESAWDRLKNTYSPRFYRMWRYYLLCFAGAFRSRCNELWQVVLSPKGVPGGYRSVR